MFCGAEVKTTAGAVAHQKMCEFAPNFIKAQQMLRDGDTDGLARMASHTAAQRAADAAARAREDNDE